jgi:hypothetical protein
MILPTNTADLSAQRDATQRDALVLLDDTARAVKVMKASWLKVATNLQRIREHQLWRFAQPSCEHFEGYVYGVLQIPSGVARRMLAAVSYTELRRPQLLNDYAEGKTDVHVPSYDVVNQLRSAEKSFAGQEESFRELESRVFDEGVGRVALKRAIEERLGDEAKPPEAEAPDLGRVLDQLARIDTHLQKLKISKESRQILARLVESLRAEKQPAG